MKCSGEEIYLRKEISRKQLCTVGEKIYPRKDSREDGDMRRPGGTSSVRTGGSPGKQDGRKDKTEGTVRKSKRKKKLKVLSF